ncbi:MAG: hypothetical protein HC888_00865 [Candidatus Competibacteraceae bacterium]|nr:hypothetical protein [Candidatus Competibacteraceae bacterium]
MSTWTDRKRITFPPALLAEANALAGILDPDTGGHLTFRADRTVGGYIYAEIPFKADFWPLVERQDLAEWKAVIPQVATAYGREPISDITIEALCESMLIGDNIPGEVI